MRGMAFIYSLNDNEASHNSVINHYRKMNENIFAILM